MYFNIYYYLCCSIVIKYFLAMYKHYYRKIYSYSLLLHLIIIAIICAIVFLFGFLQTDLPLTKFLSSEFIAIPPIFVFAYFLFLNLVIYTEDTDIKFGDFGKYMYLCDHGYEFKDYIYNVKTITYNTGEELYLPIVIIGDGVPPHYIQYRNNSLPEYTLTDRESDRCKYKTMESALMAITDWKKDEAERQKEKNKAVEKEELTEIKFEEKETE